MTKWRNDYVQVNKYTRPGYLLEDVLKIILHYTANPGATAENHQEYFNGNAIKNKRTASAHIFVDEKEAVCIVPLNEIAYHANDNYEKKKGVVYRGVKELKPNANKVSIGVEMCVEEDGTISSKTIQRTAEVIADLCKRCKLTEEDIVRHYDVTHKPCPKPFVDDEEKFLEFKAAVKKLLDAQIVVSSKPIKNVKKPYGGKLIKRGSKGKAVEEIQELLGLSVDGTYGPLTEKAVKEFQVKHGLVVDGKVGEKTWNKLFN